MTDHIDCEVDAERAQLVLPLQVHAVCVPSGKGEYICARRRGQDLPGWCLGYITTPWTDDDRCVVVCLERAGMIVRARKGTRWRERPHTGGRNFQSRAPEVQASFCPLRYTAHFKADGHAMGMRALF
ncbi:hypothetical protein BDN71DRAFT_1512064 [Pleurotus eryngii]|uniref:Uncharacterized protein n=1 Tax=Pleurotus eryngii TaxID=5323 RepID=A0A9P5ZL33_PLEER|nr:hypothetical protein BDN71DRAFT_1512064 [Pleurotus eryngii]